MYRLTTTLAVIYSLLLLQIANTKENQLNVDNMTAQTRSLFVGPLIPLIWTSGDVCPGFQSQGESLACFLTCVILQITSGMTPADCIEVRMAAEPFQSMSTSIDGGSGLKLRTICAVSTVLYTIWPLQLSQSWCPLSQRKNA